MATTLKDFAKTYREKERIASKKWYYKNRERILKKDREDYYKNINYEKERHKIYMQKPESKIKKNEYMRLRRKNSLKQIIQDKKNNLYSHRPNYLNEYRKRRKKEDKNYAIRDRLRCRIKEVIKKNLKEQKDIIPRKYKINYVAIVNHLKPFPENIKEYEIDHIVPLCSFDLTNEEQFKIATAPENHQWLPIIENRKKSGKIINNNERGCIRN